MASAKEINSKIRSIKSTQKITRAMEMISASKMRKAQERMTISRPYATKIRSVIGHVAKSHAEYRHPYLNVREVKRAGFIIVTTDRGMCGGLNTNLLKAAVVAMKDFYERNISLDLCLVGNKAGAFFKRIGGNVVATASHLGDAPQVTDLVGIVKVMLDSYDASTLDSLFIVHNEFINTMTQKPRVLQLLPIVPTEEKGLEHYWDYIYEPGAKELLDVLLKRYIESQVYQAVVENIACEQAARMVAMKNATENAGDLINALQLAYNKARQAAITQELAEIVAGASAV
jgi:F-type H+-transporting ATPase subunit gamma